MKYNNFNRNNNGEMNIFLKICMALKRVYFFFILGSTRFHLITNEKSITSDSTFLSYLYGPEKDLYFAVRGGYLCYSSSDKYICSIPFMRNGRTTATGLNLEDTLFAAIAVENVTSVSNFLRFSAETTFSLLRFLEPQNPDVEGCGSIANGWLDVEQLAC